MLLYDRDSRCAQELEGAVSQGVNDKLATRDGKLVAEFTEVGSGRPAERPQLLLGVTA